MSRSETVYLRMRVHMRVYVKAFLNVSWLWEVLWTGSVSIFNWVTWFSGPIGVVILGPFACALETVEISAPAWASTEMAEDRVLSFGGAQSGPGLLKEWT